MRKQDNDIVDSGLPVCEVVDVDYLGGHRLHLRFSDGAEGEVDLAPLTQQDIFKGLSDTRQFIRFGLERGTLVWSDSLDVSPEYLREHIEIHPGV